MKTTPDSLFVTVADLQSLFSISRAASYRLAHALGATRVGLWSIRVPLAEVERRFGREVGAAVREALRTRQPSGALLALFDSTKCRELRAETQRLTNALASTDDKPEVIVAAISQREKRAQALQVPATPDTPLRLRLTATIVGC